MTTTEVENDLLQEFLELAKLDRSWVKDAACRGLDVNLFFPRDSDAQTRKQALEICNGNQRSVMNRKTRVLELVGDPPCPVRDKCLQYVMSLPQKADPTGVYAGLSHKKRRDMRVVQNREV
jgi:hypothetical protein